MPYKWPPPLKTGSPGTLLRTHYVWILYVYQCVLTCAAPPRISMKRGFLYKGTYLNSASVWRPFGKMIELLGVAQKRHGA